VLDSLPCELATAAMDALIVCRVLMSMFRPMVLGATPTAQRDSYPATTRFGVCARGSGDQKLEWFRVCSL